MRTFSGFCADLRSRTSITERGDIFLAEFTTNSNHTLTLVTVRKVNTDNTATDQWNPAITANPQGTELFIGYYSRQNDPVNNSWIMAYGAKAVIANGLAAATFDCAPISPTSFLPVFAGTNAARGLGRSIRSGQQQVFVLTPMPCPMVREMISHVLIGPTKTMASRLLTRTHTFVQTTTLGLARTATTFITRGAIARGSMVRHRTREPTRMSNLERLNNEY